MQEQGAAVVSRVLSLSKGIPRQGASRTERSRTLLLASFDRMQKVGVETWARDEALRIRTRFKTGQFVIGRGAVLVDDAE